MEKQRLQEQATNFAQRFPFTPSDFFNMFKEVNGFGIPFVKYGYELFQDFLDDLPTVEPVNIQSRRFYQIKNAHLNSPPDPLPQPLLPPEETSNTDKPTQKSQFVSRVARLVKKCGRETTLDALNAVYLSHFGVKMVHDAKELFALVSFDDFAEFFKQALTLDEIPIYKHPTLWLFRLKDDYTVEEDGIEEAVEVPDDVNLRMEASKETGVADGTAGEIERANRPVVESNCDVPVEENTPSPSPVNEDDVQRSCGENGGSSGSKWPTDLRIKVEIENAVNEDESHHNQGEQVDTKPSVTELLNSNVQIDKERPEATTANPPDQTVRVKIEVEAPASPDNPALADNEETNEDDTDRLPKEVPSVECLNSKGHKNEERPEATVGQLDQPVTVKTEVESPASPEKLALADNAEMNEDNNGRMEFMHSLPKEVSVECLNNKGHRNGEKLESAVNQLDEPVRVKIEVESPASPENSVADNEERNEDDMDRMDEHHLLGEMLSPSPVNEDDTQRSCGEDGGSSTSDSDKMQTSTQMLIDPKRMEIRTEVATNEEELDHTQAEQMNTKPSVLEFSNSEHSRDDERTEATVLVDHQPWESESPASPDILSSADSEMRDEDSEESMEEMHNFREEIGSVASEGVSVSLQRKRLLSDSTDDEVDAKRSRLFPSEGEGDESQIVSFWETGGRGGWHEVFPEEDERREIASFERAKRSHTKKIKQAAAQKRSVQSETVIDKIKKVLEENRGVATLDEMVLEFEQRHSADFNACLNELQEEHMMQIRILECEEWFFRLRHIFDGPPTVPTSGHPFPSSPGQNLPARHPPENGVSQIVAALKECGGSCSLDEMRQVFEKRFGVQMDSQWLKEHFGTDDLSKLISHPGLSSKMTIYPTDQTYRFVLVSAERMDCGVSLMKKVLEEFGGAATWSEMQKKFKKRLITFDNSWLEFMFAVKTVDELRNIPVFNLSIELIAQPMCVFRLARSKTAEAAQPIPAIDIPLPASVSSSTSSTHDDASKVQLKALFDEFDGECTLGELKKANERLFGKTSKNALSRKIFNDTSVIGMLLGFQLITDTRTSGLDTKLSLISKEYDGRRRMIRVLTKLEGAATFDELQAGYQKVFQATFDEEMEKFFGGVPLTEMMTKLGKKILTHYKGDVLYFLLKPDLMGFSKLFEEYKQKFVGRPSLNPQEVFDHQCVLIGNLLEVGASRLTTYANVDTLCSYFEGLPDTRYKDFARFIRECPRKLLELMLPKRFAGLANVSARQKK